MNRMQALIALRDKVKAGNWDIMRDEPHEVSGLADHWHRFDAIMGNGSLDAAKALHEAVLPWSDYEIIQRGSRSTVHIFEKPLAAKWYTGVSHTRPARAWLLAILEALIAQEEQSD